MVNLRLPNFFYFINEAVNILADLIVKSYISKAVTFIADNSYAVNDM